MPLKTSPSSVLVNILVLCLYLEDLNAFLEILIHLIHLIFILEEKHFSSVTINAADYYSKIGLKKKRKESKVTCAAVVFCERPFNRNCVSALKKIELLKDSLHSKTGT